MSAIQTVVYDFGALSLLMLIGYFIRKKSKLLQDLYLPAALVAGFVGLLLGPQVLGRFSPICFPITDSMRDWPSILNAVLFSVSFLGAKATDFGETALSTTIQGGIAHQTQVCVGLLCALFFIQIGYEFPIAFGLTPVYGWYGGHGTAMAAGTLLKDMGWAEAPDVANAVATAGLFCGVVFGIIMINIGARRGMTVYVKEPTNIPREVKVGYVPPAHRKPIGFGVTYSDALDPFAFALCWSGLVCTLGHFVRTGLIAINPKLGYIPWYACCLMLSMAIGFLLKKTNKEHYIDRPSMNRIAGFSLDFLVCSAIATLNIDTVMANSIPLAVMVFAILVTNIIIYLYFGAKLFKRDAFERTVGGFGQGCGVLSTGLMLVRIVDPDGKSTAADSIAASSTLGYTFQIPYFTIIPILSFYWSFGTLFGVSLALLVLFIILGRIFFWQKEPAWKHQRVDAD